MFMLIDGTFYIYKSYYALPMLINKKKKPIGAIYGFLNILNSLIKQYKPTHIAIAFDSKKNFRKQIFKKYKSNRKKMPKNLIKQIKPLYKIIKKIGIKFFIIPGIEADDTIGAITLKFKKKTPIIISTEDKDMAQLVTNKIKLLNNKKKILGPKEIVEKFGIKPKLINDYLALVGDSSDNIPGIPGVGKKTAVNLLNNIGNLKKIYKNINKIHLLNPKISNNLINTIKKNEKKAFLYYKLTTIYTKTNIKINYSDLIIKQSNINKLNKILKNNQLNVQ